MTARNLAAGEVVEALRANNLQIASGALNQQPVPTSGAFQLSVETVGRLLDPQQFADIVVKTDAQGRVTRVRDVAPLELGARDYSTVGYDRPSVGVGKSGPGRVELGGRRIIKKHNK